MRNTGQHLEGCREVCDMKINLNATATVMLKFLAKKSNQNESEMVEELVMDEYRRSGGGAN